MLAEHAQSPGIDPKVPQKLDTMAQVCNPSTLAEVGAEIQGHLWLCIELGPALAVKDHI